MTGYTAGFAGLLSSGEGGTLAIAGKIPGARHYRHGQWPAVLKEIIAQDKAGRLARPLCLFGHSMGGEAVLEICAGLAQASIEVDYAGIIDLTLGPVTSAGGNIRLLEEFHAQYQHVRFKGFKGEHRMHELDQIMADNIGHSQAARLEFTQSGIIQSIATLTREARPVTKLPAELNRMVLDAGKAIDPAGETPDQTLFNQTFFNAIRPQFGTLSQSAVDGMKTILHAFDTYIAPKGYDDALLAFVLGNVFNETGGKMIPLRETNAATHEGAMAALAKWWASGKAQKAGVKSQYWLDGYYGRGLFQETHFGNYSKGAALWEKWFAFPLDFVGDPDLFLNPVVSALSAFIGSIEGKYTGKKFSEFCKDGECDFAEARRMINGDRNLVLRDVDGDGVLEKMGDEIGDVCQAFLDAINKARGAIDHSLDDNTDKVPVPADPAPPVITGDIIADLDDIRVMLQTHLTNLTPEGIDMVLGNALMRHWLPLETILPDKWVQADPDVQDENLKPEEEGNTMLKNTFNFKSKTALTGMFSVAAGFAMFILPEGNMLLELARSFFPEADPGTLITGGLAIIFARDAIAKNGNGK